MDANIINAKLTILGVITPHTKEENIMDQLEKVYAFIMRDESKLITPAKSLVVN